jgi:hypothetical protein
MQMLTPAGPSAVFHLGPGLSAFLFLSDVRSAAVSRPSPSSISATNRENLIPDGSRAPRISGRDPRVGDFFETASDTSSWKGKISREVRS